MNRIIKFRAWDTVEKYMTDSFYLSADGFVYDIPEKRYDTPHVEIIKTLAYRPMQFTGLKDRDGKDVYEGDILTGGLEVVWVDECAGFKFNPSRANKDISFMESPVNYLAKECQYSGMYEIIGNIYQNPELLNK